MDSAQLELHAADRRRPAVRWLAVACLLSCGHVTDGAERVAVDVEASPAPEPATEPVGEPARAPLHELASEPERAPPEVFELDAPAAEWSVVIDCSEQRAYVRYGARDVATYTVSTSRFGLGSRAGSNKTPLGRHAVAQKFGAGEPLGAVFEGRRPTGRVAEVLGPGVDVEEDLITTRILWLDGLEPGLNRGPGIDSKSRYIYIHGTNEEGLLGRPASHGCIRMSNRDVRELFATIPVGTSVTIRE